MSGFQSYSSYVPENAEVYQAGPQLRQESPVLRTSSSNGAMTTSSEQATDRGREGQLNPAYGTEDWKASAMTKGGRVVTNIQGDTLVTIAGVQGTVEFFVDQGMLQQGADGKYTEGTGNPPAPQVVDGDSLPLDAGAMSVVNAALGPLPQESLDGVTAQAIGVALGRLDDASLTKKFSKDSGLDPAESHERLTTIKAIYQAQADSALESRSGIGKADSVEFWAWAKSRHGGQLQEAIGKQLRSADVSGYAALAERWLSETPPTLEALKAGGIPTKVQDGALLCHVRGTWLTPKAAAQAGFI